MQITMLEARDVSPDGATVEHLFAGETYELPDELATRLIDRGYAQASGTKTKNQAHTEEGPDETDADGGDDTDTLEAPVETPKPRRSRGKAS